MLKIFVVENEPLIRKGIIKYIQRDGEDMQVVGEAGDGELAYPKILETEPDLLITDIMMPYMDGLELGESLRRKLPNLKIIIISGYSEFDYAQKAIRIGVVDYLLKPIFADTLLEAIRKVQDELQEEQENMVSLEQIDIKAWNEISIDQFLKKGLRQEAEPFTEHYLESAGDENIESFFFRQYIVVDMQLAVIRFLDELGEETDLGGLLRNAQELVDYVKTREGTKEYVREILERAIEVRDSAAGDRYGEMLEKAKGYIREHYNKDISLNTVAEYVGVSPNHFSKIFSQETGHTFIEYITQVRMEHAKEMLRCSNKKIAEICHEVGYQEANYFYTLFKKTCSCTPSEYRKRSRG